MNVTKNQLLCAVVGITLSVAAFFVDQMDSPLQDGYGLERNSYGQGEKEEEILIEGLSEDKIPITLQIGERRYDEKEAEAAMDALAERLPEQIAGDNPSLNEVRMPLNLPVWLDEWGIRIDWKPENRELLEPDGMIHGEESPESGTQTQLTAVLTAGEYTAEYLFTVRIFPPDRSVMETKLLQFQAMLRQIDEGQSTLNQFVLPEEYEGKRLRYSKKPDYSFVLFSCLGFLTAALLPLRKRQKLKEEAQRRERQMLLDYPEIVSKLVVFSGAGLPIRKAWERIVLDYERNSKEKRAAYEEMAGVYHMMQRGVSELQAYAEFGNRCRCLPYRKLSGLLEQNLRNGSEGLRRVLENEMENAFEQKKNLARKMGEEASTKLLLPLFMLLLIVMVMVTVPAFLSFGIG